MLGALNADSPWPWAAQKVEFLHFLAALMVRPASPGPPGLGTSSGMGANWRLGGITPPRNVSKHAWTTSRSKENPAHPCRFAG
jgi:hypothetical protein